MNEVKISKKIHWNNKPNPGYPEFDGNYLVNTCNASNEHPTEIEVN